MRSVGGASGGRHRPSLRVAPNMCRARPFIVLCLSAATRAHIDELASGIALSDQAWPGRDARVEQRLRKQLLHDLDSKVPPTTNIGGAGGVKISVQYRIFKVLSMDISSGSLVLKVWRRMVWWDDRLRWEPTEHQGIEDFRAYPGTGGIDDNLWRPPVVLYNAITPEASTLDVGAAWVRHDGRVWWSVPGTVDVACRFAGLVKFPRDTLKCTLEIGSWAYGDRDTNLTYFDEIFPDDYPHPPRVRGLIWKDVSGTRPAAGRELQSAALLDALLTKTAVVGSNQHFVQFGGSEADALKLGNVARTDYILVDGSYFSPADPLGCADFGAQSVASGVSYQEYSIVHIVCAKNTRYYTCCPDKPFTALWIELHMQRQSRTYYVLTIEMPGIIITALSFLPMLLDVTQGERLGFGATMLLTILLLMTIVGEIVPRCGEMLWVHLLNWTNFGFCMLSTVETVVISYIMYSEYDHKELEVVGEQVGEQVSKFARRLSPTGGGVSSGDKHKVGGAQVSVGAENHSGNEDVRLNPLQRAKSTLKSYMKPTRGASDEGADLARAVDRWSFRIIPPLYVLTLAYIYALDPKDEYETTFTRTMFSSFWPAHDVFGLFYALAPPLALLWGIVLYRWKRADAKSGEATRTDTGPSMAPHAAVEAVAREGAGGQLAA